MIKKIWMLLILALFAGCGAPMEDEVPSIEDTPETMIIDDEPVDIGQIQQPLYVEPGYGIEVNTNKACPTTTWDGGCWMPDNIGSDLVYGWFITSNCSATWKTLITDIVNEQDAVGGTFGNIDFVKVQTQQAARYIFDCTTSNGAPGTTTFVQEETHDTPLGKIRQFQRIVSLFRTTPIETAAGYTAGTQAQRDRVRKNVIRHEVSHALGFGHTGESASDALMEPTYNTAVGGQWYSLDRKLNSTQLHQLDCYNPTSSTSPRC